MILSCLSWHCVNLPGWCSSDRYIVGRDCSDRLDSRKPLWLTHAYSLFIRSFASYDAEIIKSVEDLLECLVAANL